jgi:3-dehydroquinate dehydratase
MKLVVTVLEDTCDAAMRAIRAIELAHDMVEVRAERFPSIDFGALRAATQKPMILTWRGAPHPGPLPVRRGEGTYVDVEWHDGVTIDDPATTVISHHDYEGVRNVETIMAKMRALNCAGTPSSRPRHETSRERTPA